MKDHVLAIDQGTTGTRVLVLGRRGQVVARGYSELRQHYPKPGWVEHDADEIWRVTLRVVRSALRKASLTARDLAAIGITNQRETTLLWDRKTAKPVYRAIVWQDRRTTPFCDELARKGMTGAIRKKTGLVIDPYFSGTKIRWLLDNVEGVRRRAERGDLAFGTIDTWLLWKLSGGRVHATDFTNASRTLLFDIRRRCWDDALLAAIGVPAALLPEIVPSSGVICESDPAVLGAPVPVAGMAGDQQAALFGQGCFRPGMAKNTYGTGAFVVMPTGDRPVTSKRGLLTTLACGADGGPMFALEGSIFVAGAAVQWIRDQLRWIRRAAETDAIARRTPDSGGVYVVPAFVGLGAPYWDPEARGAIVGLTRGSGREQIIRATLESVAFQTRDVVDVMVAETGKPLKTLRVDGGASRNNFLMQFQADLLGASVDRPKTIETTATGAAFLAGLGTGLWKSTAELERIRKVDRVFKPTMKVRERDRRCAGWADAVARVRTRS